MIVHMTHPARPHTPLLTQPKHPGERSLWATHVWRTRRRAEAQQPSTQPHTYRLNSSRGLVAWEWAEGETCSGFRLLEKACRCLISRRTTSTCSSVGVNDS